MRVAGARSNSTKVASFMEALQAVAGIHQALVDTGRHYEATMTKVPLGGPGGGHCTRHSLFQEAIDEPSSARIPGLWEGKTSMRITNVIREFLHV